MFIARYKRVTKYLETNRKNIRTLSLSCLVLFSLSSCHDDNETNPQSARTVIIYMAAENSLANNNFQIKDINEMIQSCKDIPQNSELVIFLDAPTESSIYTLNRNCNYLSIDDMKPEHAFPDNQNSASADCLKNIIQYVEQHHKSESYGIVLWSHGSGWIEDDKLSSKKSNRVPRKSFGLDNQEGTTSNDGYRMEIKKMKEALSAVNFDFILFDACFMQSIEVAYELRNSAKYIIASPAEIPGPGAPYHKMMRHLFSQPFNPGSVVDSYHLHYIYEEPKYGLLLSAVRTDQLEHFANVTRDVLSSHTLEQLDVEDVQNYFEYDSWNGWYSRDGLPDMYDIKGMMKKNLSTHDYEMWKSALDSLVVSSCCSNSWYSDYAQADVELDTSQYSGVSMFVPLQKYISDRYQYYNSYFDTQWAKDISKQKE